jgi:pimeloyl-ACP methyl ester carboxylesterase
MLELALAQRFWVALRIFRLSLVLCSLFLASSCYLVYVKQKRMERFIKEQGLAEKVVNLGEDQIHYWEGGSGPPLLLVHGFGADATWGWSGQVEELSRHFRLVVPDLLWFGGSSSKKRDFSVDHQVKMLRNLMTHLGFARYDVAGISYGGIVSYVLVNEADSRVNRAVIVSSPGPYYTQEDYNETLARFDVDGIDKLILPVDSDGLLRLFSIAYRKPPYIPWGFRQNILDSIISPQREEKLALLDSALEQMKKQKPAAYKANKKMLIIWGSDDPLFKVELGSRLLKQVSPYGDLKVFTGARHALNLEYAREFNKTVIEFLQ